MKQLVILEVYKIPKESIERNGSNPDYVLNDDDKIELIEDAVLYNDGEYWCFDCKYSDQRIDDEIMNGDVDKVINDNLKNAFENLIEGIEDIEYNPQTLHLVYEFNEYSFSRGCEDDVVIKLIGYLNADMELKSIKRKGE